MATALSSRSLRTGGRITVAQLSQANSAFRAQVSQGIYAVAHLDEVTFDLARSYGERYGGALGVRALDVLHVAAAVRFGAVAFGTFDTRQAKLALEVGLRVLA
jgi:predicted nucleic acid-binding protein